MPKVNSSNIDSVDYDPKTKTMTVTFNHGGAYTYANVSQVAYDEFLNSKSVGAHFHKHIRSAYEGKRKTSESIGKK